MTDTEKLRAIRVIFQDFDKLHRSLIAGGQADVIAQADATALKMIAYIVRSPYGS